MRGRLSIAPARVNAVPRRRALRLHTAAGRRQDDDVVYVRIAYHETDLRERAKRLGAIWRQPQKLWEITYRDSKRLGIEDRIAESC